MQADDILTYNREYLETLSKDELQKLLKIANDKADEYFTLQQSNKILINSLYGAQANPGFVLFNEKIAQAITGNGRFFIKLVARRINEKLAKLARQQSIPSNINDYVYYGDTDSVYYTIEPFVNNFIQNNPDAQIIDIVHFCDEFSDNIIDKIISDTVDDFSYVLNAFNPSKISAKREIIADVMVCVAKKKYAAKLRESEGIIFAEDSPKVKIMGLELIKSITPPFSKKYLREAVDIILDGTNEQLLDWFEVVKRKFILADVNDIAVVSSTNKIDYDLEGVDPIPIAARASIYYNNYITKNNLLNKYVMVQPGEKVKIVCLKDANPFASVIKRKNGKILVPNIIAYQGNEFGKELRDYVDFDKQFLKAFLNPLKIMTDAINFNTQRKLDDVFDF